MSFIVGDGNTVQFLGWGEKHYHIPKAISKHTAKCTQMRHIRNEFFFSFSQAKFNSGAAAYIFKYYLQYCEPSNASVCRTVVINKHSTSILCRWRKRKYEKKKKKMAKQRKDNKNILICE